MGTDTVTILITCMAFSAPLSQSPVEGGGVVLGQHVDLADVAVDAVAATQFRGGSQEVEKEALVLVVVVMVEGEKEEGGDGNGGLT